MTVDEITRVADMVRDAVLPLLRDEVMREIHGRMESYRRSWVTRDEWCCKGMREFAVKAWAAPSHKGVHSFMYLGQHIVYCPCCGVKL